jgi:Flp pilus assembly protein TadD
MRFLAPLFALPILVVLLNTDRIQAAERGQSVSGRFVFENTDFACDQCIVSLLADGVRPIGTTYIDLAGRFTFLNVPRGTYTVHAQIDGFEDVNQPVETSDVDASLVISLVRKHQPVGHGGEVVNITEFKELYPKKAVAFYGKGSEALGEKKYEQAIKYFRQAIELAPTFYDAHNQLGIAYQASGRSDDAEKEFITAHELNATGFTPLLNLTNLYLNENEPDRAVKTGEEAVKVNSHSAPAFFSLGVALYKIASLDRAEAALKRALELAPRMPNVRLMLANVYLKLHRYDNTLDQLNSYIAENPNGSQLQAAEQMRDQILKAEATARP